MPFWMGMCSVTLQYLLTQPGAPSDDSMKNVGRTIQAEDKAMLFSLAVQVEHAYLQNDV